MDDGTLPDLPPNRIRRVFQVDYVVNPALASVFEARREVLASARGRPEKHVLAFHGTSKPGAIEVRCPHF